MRIDGPNGEPLARVSFKYTEQDAASWPALFRDLATSIERLLEARGGSGSATFVADLAVDYGDFDAAQPRSGDAHADMKQLTVQMDDETAGRVREFAEFVKVSPEEAASQLVGIAASVREVMRSKGLLESGDVGEFIVSFQLQSDGTRAVDFRRM
jgi:hypothetical protein